MISDALLLSGIGLFLCVMLYWQRRDDRFDLRWLVVDTKTDHVSLFKFGQFTALLSSTWALIYETRHGHLTEWLFGAYIVAWSGINVANKFAEKYKQESK